MRLFTRRVYICLLLITATLLLMVLNGISNITEELNLQQSNIHVGAVSLGSELVRVERDVPLVWVGGVPRSGTTLMR